MNTRTLFAAIALVCLAYAVVVSADADAQASPSVSIDCEAWAHGATTPAAITALCRREALLRLY